MDDSDIRRHLLALRERRAERTVWWQAPITLVALCGSALVSCASNRFRFSLAALLALVTLCCVFFGTLYAYWASRPREFPLPCLTFSRSHTKMGIEDNIYLQFDKDGWERYEDYQPLGTLNYALLPAIRPHRGYLYQEELENTPLADSIRPMPAAIQQRYEALRKFVAERVDIDALELPARRQWVLPVDYPTIDRFLFEMDRDAVAAADGATGSSASDP